MTATYRVSASTAQSTMTVGVSDATEALRRAEDMTSPRVTVTITDSEGQTYSAETFAATLDGAVHLPLPSDGPAA